MKLWDYQQQAVDFIKKKKRVYLALDLGMGKTITSLAAMDSVAKKNIMLVAEKNEIVNSQNFKKEVENYFFVNDVKNYGLSYLNLRNDELPDVQENCRYVCGINPDGLVKHDVNDINESTDVMIVDEATTAKTTTTARFKRVHKIAKEMEYLVLLSGTPMMNGAAELYAPLLLLEHPMIADKGAKGRKAFEAVFAGGHYRKIRNTGKWFQDYVWWAKGANNVRVLRYLIKDNFFFMRKTDTKVFKKKTRTIRTVPMTLPWLAEYQNAWNEYLITARKRNVNMDNVMELQQLIENGQIYQVNSRWKADSVVSDIASGRYGDKRIVIFSMFIETDLLIREYLRRMDISYRTFDEVREWKEGNEQVLVGRIQAHGKGTNLPEASVALFVDMSFVPAQNIQAECRIDRPEQKNDMLVVYYITEGKDVIDEHVRRINQDKARKIDEFMRPLTAQEIAEMPDMIEALKQKFPKECAILGIGYPQLPLMKV